MAELMSKMFSGDGIPRLMSWLFLFGCSGALIWALGQVNPWVGFLAGAAIFGPIALRLETRHQEHLRNEVTLARANASRPQRFDDDDD